MSDDIKKSAIEILTPKSAEVFYGGEKRTISPFGISDILKLVKQMSNRLGQYWGIMIEKITNAEKLEKIVGLFDEDIIVEILSISLKIDIADVKKGFKAIDAIMVIKAIFEYEEVEKIFFEVQQMTTRINKGKNS